MLGSLPTELVIEIIVEAAERFVVVDRATAVSLAMTARYVFNLVRPILLRRFFITDSNRFQVDAVLTNQEAGALVIDFNIASSVWEATPEVVNCLKNLRHIRGVTKTVEAVIDLLSESAKVSLRDIQLWDEELIPNLPVGVTSVCLYGCEEGEPPLNSLVSWLRLAPSITQIGVEIVSRRDFPMNVLPDDLTRGLQSVLTAGGPRLQRVAVRICGEPSDDEPWGRLIASLKVWSGTKNMADMQADRRVALWRDMRIFDNATDDVQAGIDDPLAGIDIWMAARPLVEW